MDLDTNIKTLDIFFKETYLRNRGWNTWYNEDYWVHPKLIHSPLSQDYTNYGMSLDKAYEWEIKRSKL